MTNEIEFYESKRLEFHEVLCSLLGTRNVYYQPPENVKMVYPAIVYELNRFDIYFAEDSIYRSNVSFKVTLITKDPVSRTVSELMRLPYSSMSSFFRSEGLNHFVFNIYKT